MKFSSLKIFVCLVVIFLAPKDRCLAQEKTEQSSVYDASTHATEKPEIKILSLEQFSAFAAGICKKYQFEGLIEVKGPVDVAELKKKLTEARKKLFTRLCDPEVRKDEMLKSELQSQMKSLTEDIRTFPILEGMEIISIPSNKNIAGKMVSKPVLMHKPLAPGLNNLADPIKDVRDQVYQKHRKYYVTPMPKK